MADRTKDLIMEESRRVTWKEPVAVYLSSVVLIFALVALDSTVGLGGLLHPLVAAVFIGLPVFVMDRRKADYAAYGITWSGAYRGTASALILVLVIFPLFILGAPLYWNIADLISSGCEGGFFESIGSVYSSCSPVWPSGYVNVLFGHLIIVALPDEFFYRGYLQSSLDEVFTARKRFLGADLGWGFIIQAGLFALGHFTVDFNPARLGVFFPALAFGWLRAREGGIVGPIIFHTLCNMLMDLLLAGCRT